MDSDFEDIILKYRAEFAFCQDKNLDLSEGHYHADLKAKVEEPVFLHISHSRSNDETFNKFMKYAPYGSVLTLHLTIR